MNNSVQLEYNICMYMWSGTLQQFFNSLMWYFIKHHTLELSPKCQWTYNSKCFFPSILYHLFVALKFWTSKTANFLRCYEALLQLFSNLKVMKGRKIQLLFYNSKSFVGRFQVLGRINITLWQVRFKNWL